MNDRIDAAAWTLSARLIAATIGLGAFLANFDVTSVVVVIPAIGRDLGLRSDSLAWLIDAYSIAFTASLLVAGAMADRYGRRRALLIGNAWFLLASLACGLATTAPLFLAARAAQGAGAAFLITGSLASIATTFPLPGIRARALGTVGVVSGVAMALGPSLGGLIGTQLGWRWVFLANVLPCVLLGILVPRCVAERRDETSRALDWTGVALLTAALATMIAAILEARHTMTRLTLGLTTGIGLIALSVVRQRRHVRPMLHPDVFATRPMAGVAALLLSVSAGYWAVLVYLPLFLGTRFGWAADVSGLALLAATLPMLLVPPFAGRLVTTLGWRRLFAAAMAIVAAGGGALILAALAEPERPALVCAFAGMILIGTGAALSHPQLSGAVIALAPPDAGGMASAITIVFRQAGFAVGVAALGALTPAVLNAGGFAWPFGLAALASLGGVLACTLLPPRPPR